MTINVNKKKVVPDLAFFTAQRSENMFYIFTSENINFSKYAFYFINNSLYFITLYIIKIVSVTGEMIRYHFISLVIDITVIFTRYTLISLLTIK